MLETLKLQRLHQKHQELQEQHATLSEKIRRLREAVVVETNQSVKFQIERDFEQVEQDRARVETAMGELESQIEQMQISPDPHEPPAQSLTLSRKKFFISYAHTNPDEENLACFLHSQLLQTGHETFIDVGMKAGMDWIQEITNRLNWCDGFVVLLSEHSMQSEIVLEEVRIARRRQRDTGLPRIIPVRLRDFGPLEYELDICLGQLQFLKWRGPQDNALVLQELLRSMRDESAQTTPSTVSTLKSLRRTY